MQDLAINAISKLCRSTMTLCTVIFGSQQNIVTVFYKCFVYITNTLLYNHDRTCYHMGTTFGTTFSITIDYYSCCLSHSISGNV